MYTIENMKKTSYLDIFKWIIVIILCSLIVYYVGIKMSGESFTNVLNKGPKLLFAYLISWVVLIIVYFFIK